MSRRGPPAAGAAFGSPAAHANQAGAKRSDSMFLDKSKKGRKCGPVKHSALPNTSASSATEESAGDGDTEDSSAEQDDEDEDDDEDENDEESDDLAPSDDIATGKKKYTTKEPRARQTGLPTGPRPANHRKRNSAHLSGEFNPGNQKRSRPAETSGEDDMSDDEQFNETTLFSDGGYSAAGDISESDDSDTARENAEEAIIAQEETATGRRRSLSTDSLVGDLDVTDFEGFPPDPSFLMDSNHFFDEEFHQSVSFDGAFLERDNTPVPGRKDSDMSGRHVHFADGVPGSDTSDSASTGYLESAFPDLMMESELSMSVRRAIDRQYIEDLINGDVMASDSDTSFWDFEDENASQRSLRESPSKSGSDKSESLSGYETDIGDTTDEEELVPIPRVSAQPEPARPKSKKSDKSPTPTSTPKTPVSKSARRKGPRMGTFIPDPDKTVVMYDGNSTRLIYRASQIRCDESHLIDDGKAASNPNSLTNSPATTFLDMVPDISPMVRGTANDLHTLLSPTLSNVFGAAPGQQIPVGDQTIGAMDPFFSNALQFDEDTEDDDTETDIGMQLGEFISLSDTEEEAIAETSEDALSPTSKTADLLPAFSSPAPVRRSSRDHVSHLLTGGVVGSFKYNQERHRELSSRHANRFNLSQPVRHGRTANSLITPPRRRRGNSNPHAKAMSRKTIAGIVGHGSARRT